jgi:hypothetical protein
MKQRPVETLRDGALKAAILRNDSENGAFHAVTFARTFKDSDGDLQGTDSVSGSQLLRLARLAEYAYDRTAKLTKKAPTENGSDEEADAYAAPLVSPQGCAGRRRSLAWPRGSSPAGIFLTLAPCEVQCISKGTVDEVRD